MTPSRPLAAPAERPSTLATAVLATYGANAAAAVLSLLNVAVVAHALGPIGRGDVAFLIAVATLGSHVAGCSVQEANANLAGAEPELRAALATNSVVLAAVLGIAAGVVILSLRSIAPAIGGPVDVGLLALAVGAIPIVVARSYLSFLARAEYGFAVANVAWVIGPATGLVVNTALAAGGHLTVTSAISAWVAGQLVATMLIVGWVRRHSRFGRFDLALARRALGFGARVHVGHLMAVGNYRGDQWILGATRGSRELGLYSVAVSWAEALFYLPGVLVAVQRPDLVRAEPREAARLATKVYRSAVPVGVAATVVLVVAAPILCTVVFGDRFAGSVDDLRILALGAVGILSLELLRNPLTAQGKPLLASVGLGVAFVVTVVLDVVLIPAHGGAGAAFATTAAYTAGGAAVAVIFVRSLHAPAADLVPRRSDLRWLCSSLRRGVGATFRRRHATHLPVGPETAP